MGFKPGDDSQQRGFAATGRSDNRDELADVGKVLDDEGDIFESEPGVGSVPEAFAHVFKYHDIGPPIGDQVRFSRRSQHVLGVLRLLLREGLRRGW